LAVEELRHRAEGADDQQKWISDRLLSFCRNPNERDKWFEHRLFLNRTKWWREKVLVQEETISGLNNSLRQERTLHQKSKDDIRQKEEEIACLKRQRDDIEDQAKYEKAAKGNLEELHRKKEEWLGQKLTRSQDAELARKQENEKLLEEKRLLQERCDAMAKEMADFQRSLAASTSMQQEQDQLLERMRILQESNVSKDKEIADLKRGAITSWQQEREQVLAKVQQSEEALSSKDNEIAGLKRELAETNSLRQERDSLFEKIQKMEETEQERSRNQSWRRQRLEIDRSLQDAALREDQDKITQRETQIKKLEQELERQREREKDQIGLQVRKCAGEKKVMQKKHEESIKSLEERCEKAEAALKASEDALRQGTLQTEVDQLRRTNEVLKQRIEDSRMQREFEVDDLNNKVTDLTRKLGVAEAKQEVGASRNNSFGELVFEFRNRNKWMKFNGALAFQATSALRAGKRNAEVKFEEMTYSLNFVEMTQTNRETATVRDLRISFRLPEFWVQKPEDLISEWRQQVAGLDANSTLPFPMPSLKRETWDDVARALPEGDLVRFYNLLEETVHHHGPKPGKKLTDCDRFHESFRVEKAWHIENVALLKDYLHAVEGLTINEAEALDPVMEVKSRLLDLQASSSLGPLTSQAGERFLLHGTSYDKLEGIVCRGFDPQRSDRPTYGHGTYFASQSCKSWQYRTRAAKHQQRQCKVGYIVIARVALGKPFYATKVDVPKEQRRRPPDGFNSVLAKPGKMPGHRHGNGQQCHCEYVIFNRGQIYPEYVLQVSGN